MATVPDVVRSYSLEDFINIALQKGLLTNLSITPIGPHTSINNMSSAQTLTPIGVATKILVQCITQNVRYTINGTTPTTTLGFRLVAGDSPYIISIPPGNTLKVIEETATAVLQYQWLE